MQFITFSFALICGIFVSKSTRANEALDFHHGMWKCQHIARSNSTSQVSYHFHFSVTSTCINANKQHQ